MRTKPRSAETAASGRGSGRGLRGMVRDESGRAGTGTGRSPGGRTAREELWPGLERLPYNTGRPWDARDLRPRDCGSGDEQPYSCRAPAPPQLQRADRRSMPEVALGQQRFDVVVTRTRLDVRSPFISVKSCKSLPLTIAALL